jgi:8-oxo-dGTP pyrophosphatase MutT (NUDIX family)
VHFTEYHTRLAAYALIVDDTERVLLTWYNGSGRGEACWSLPGGGVEYDETVEEAVVREALEETGYDVVLHEPLAVHSFTGPAEPDRPLPFKSVRVVYRATIVGGSLGTLEDLAPTSSTSPSRRGEVSAPGNAASRGAASG